MLVIPRPSKRLTRPASPCVHVVNVLNASHYYALMLYFHLSPSLFQRPLPLLPTLLDKTRRNQSYVDCASNSVLETTAMAHPSTPASQLYEMARVIEANITIRTADWLKCKILPT